MLNIKRNLISAFVQIASKAGYKIIERKYAFYDPQKYLLVEKNKFSLSRRKDKPFDVVNDFINDENTYDHIWNSNDFVSNYLDDQRLSLFRHIIHILSKRRDIYRFNSAIDVGCGTGDFLKELSNEFEQLKVFGVDYSASSVSRCKTLIPNGEFKVLDIFKLSELRKTFDLVFCMEVLEHIEFPEKGLLNLCDICDRDGLLVITVPDGRSDGWIGHINFWSPDEFEDLLLKSGLNIEFSEIIEDYFLLYICSKFK
jgi:SAM-dependent methyltransferase